MPEISQHQLDELQHDAEAYRLLADAIGALASDGWDGEESELYVLTRFVQHLATFHPDCPGYWCDRTISSPAVEQHDPMTSGIIAADPPGWADLIDTPTGDQP